MAVPSANVGLPGLALLFALALSVPSIWAASPTIGMPDATACGITVAIIDAGSITIMPGTLTVALDGDPLNPSVARSGLITKVTVEPPDFLQPGSEHSLAVRFTDSSGQAVVKTQDLTVPFYSFFPSSAAVMNYDARSLGFKVRTVWAPGMQRGPGDPNSIANAEAQLAGRYVDAFGTPLANQAELSGTDTNGFFTVPLINFEQKGQDIDGHPDNFDSLNPPGHPQPNQTIPGVPAGDRDNLAVEILTYLSLGRGCYTLGVNSDDGFIATLGTSAFGTVLGAFNSGRPAGDSIFQIAVEKDGVYPVRLAWWEGTGGASLEFFSITDSGERILINDRSNPEAIPAYSIGHAPGALLNVGAYQQNTGIDDVTRIVARFRDDLTRVDLNSVSLSLDGISLAGTATKAQGITTFIFGPTQRLAPGSDHTGSLSYSIGGLGNSAALSFRVRAETAAELPGGLVMEIEHFDFGGGKMIPSVNKVPYSGNEYSGLSAVAEVDYHRPDSITDGDVYRLGELPNVPMEADVTPNTLNVQRPGGWNVTANYRIGWAGNDWYNFTRAFTNGNYKVYAAQSDGNNAGDPNHLRSRFGIVTSGWGTPNQGVFMIGSYSEPATGGWGNDALVKVKDNGADAVVHLSGTNTVRVFVDEGDFDWLAFVPTTESTPPPSVAFVSPDPASTTLAGALNVDLRDLFRDRTIQLNTIRLLVNGQDVTTLSSVSKTTEGAHVSYAPAGGFSAGLVDYILKFGISDGTVLSYETNFVSVGANPFIVEAEDFNYESGKTLNQASVMPLTSGLYQGLGAVPGIDYHSEGDEVSSNAQPYRKADNLSATIVDNSSDLGRGPFDLDANFRIARVTAGDWFNYTRTFPAGRYTVWAALSHGDAGPTSGSLHLVANDRTQPSQVLNFLGNFNVAGGTGGWGLNRLAPLVDANGSPVAISLSGVQTVRFIAGSGDFDFLAFIPVEGNSDSGPPAKLSVIDKGQGKLHITWSNGGSLEASPVLGPAARWTPVGTAGAADVTTDGGSRYFRVKR